MERKTMKERKLNIQIIVYALVLAAAVIYMLFNTDILKREYDKEVIRLSGEWNMVDEKTSAHVDIDELDASEYNGEALLTSLIPDDPDAVADKDLCFWSDNARFSVSIDKKEVYSFDREENLTGHGYGRTYHVVKLTRDDAGKSINIRLNTVFDDRSGGRIGGFCLANGMNYVRSVSSRLFPAYVLSVIILFFGLLMVATYIWIPDKTA